MRLNRVFPLAAALALAVCVLLPGRSLAQVDYEVTVFKWSRLTQTWEKYVGHPVYFLINNVPVVARPVAPFGNFQARVPERAGQDWSVWVGPYRYQYSYHSGGSRPGTTWGYGGATFASNRRTGVLYIDDLF